MANPRLLAQSLGHNIWQWHWLAGAEAEAGADAMQHDLSSGYCFAKVSLFVWQNNGTLHEIIVNRTPFKTVIARLYKRHFLAVSKAND